MKGKFIVIEGIDGSGKTTQIEMLDDKLTLAGIDTYLTKEPSDGRIGKYIREILTGKVKVSPHTLAVLFTADRMDHITNEENGLLSKINNGTTVLCDRYYFSSYAYQNEGAPISWVINMNSQAFRLLRPDLTIFIDTTPEVAMERINKNRNNTELFEKLDTLKSVRDTYLRVFNKFKDRENIVIIDGNQDIYQINNEISEYIYNLYDRKVII